MARTPQAPRPGSRSGSMFPDLDAAYERQLEAMARVRRAVATVATSRKKLELRLEEIQQEPTEGEGGAEAELAEVRRQLDAARAEERRVSEASQRLQVRVSALHDAKAAVEAACVAADETARATLAEVTGS
jgi:phage shock protein A